MKERRGGRADRRRRHMERHIADIPDPTTHPWRYRYVATKWRLGLAISTHPVLVALTVAMIVVSVPIYQLVGVSSKVRTQQRQLTGLVKQIQTERKNTVGVFCGSINKNIESSRQLTTYLKALIVSGAKQSVAFEDLYRSHHFPPYLARLKQAKRQAEKIQSFSGPKLKCEELRKRIEATTPPPPGPPKPPAQKGG